MDRQQDFTWDTIAWWQNRAVHYTQKGQKEIARRSIESARALRLRASRRTH